MTRTNTSATAAAINALLYRPDIDGLRAVAVLAVVIFHAFPAALPGGFVGVDIFFVISGYLITGIIVAGLQAQRFSILAFYARRVRRIFPSLAIVLLATYAIGWFCLYADEYRTLGKHMVAGVGFISNWTLWTEAGYFDQAASTKPLLHLWSLGIEEQFYIVWPILLMLAFRRGKVGPVAIVVGVASFALNILLIGSHPSAAFFWPVSRFWELLSGAGLAIGMQNERAYRCAFAHAGALSGLGLLLCAMSFAVLNAQLAFPGWWALLPVLGAASLIAAGGHGWAGRHLLAHPSIICIGRISYALYLWHWPLLSFATIIAGDVPSPTVRTGIVFISVVLAWVTTVVVERPVRFGSPSRWKIVVPCVVMIIVGYLGGMTYVRDGLGFRKGYSPHADVSTAKLGAGREFTDRSCGVAPADRHLFQFCATDKRAIPHYAVWGDSKADALYWGLMRAAPKGQGWMLVARASCAPMAGVERVSSNSGDDPRNCRDADQKALQMLVGARALTMVVLVMSNLDVVGPSFAYAGSGKSGPTAVLDGLDNAVSALQRSGKRVALVMDNPRLRDPRLCMDRRPLAWPVLRQVLGVTNLDAANRCAISYHDHVTRTTAYRALVDQLKRRHPDLIVFDPAPILCDIGHDVCPMTMNGKYQYSYGDHISDYSNGRIADQLLPLLTR